MSEIAPRPISPLGQRVRAFREERGLSVRVLAASAGIHASSINGLEVGRQQTISHLRLIKLARALGVAPSDLEPELAAAA